MALPYSGTISMGDINVELGRARTTSNSRLAGAATPTVDSLFGLATGTINKVSPHRISEFYGYSQGASPWQFYSGFQQYMPPNDSTLGILGYTVPAVNMTSVDDGYNVIPTTMGLSWIMNTATGLVGYTQFFLSSNGYITFGSGTGNIFNTPQQNNRPSIGGNMGDQWFQPGLSLNDGNVHGLWVRSNDYGNGKAWCSIFVFGGRYGSTYVPITYQINLYEDSVYQYVECRVADNAYVNPGGIMGPYDSTGNVGVATSIQSSVWRSPVGGGTWTSLGAGAIDNPVSQFNLQFV